MADRDPAAAGDIRGELNLMRLIVGGHFARGDRPAVDDQLDLAPAACEWTRAGRVVVVHRVAHEALTTDGNGASAAMRR